MPPTEAEDEPAIVWSTLPLVERPLTSVAVLLFIGLILFFIYSWFQSLYWVALAGIVLFMSLSAYFVPTRYELYEEYIIIRRFITTQTKHWSDFKRLYADKNGAFLSPFEKPNRLENFRGVFLRIPRNRAQILAFLKQKIPLKPSNGEGMDDGAA